MVRFGSLLALVVAAIFIAQGCKKNKEDCPFLAPQLVFVGFTEAERDTIIFRRYENNGLFTSPLDTLLVAKADITVNIVGQDSVALSSVKYPDINSKFFANNWEIYFPGAGRTVRISEVLPTFTKEREASAQCQSYVSSVNVDGQTFTFSSWFDKPYRVYAMR